MTDDLQPSDSSAQRDAEAAVLAGVSRQFGIDLGQKVRIAFGDSVMEVDGATGDGLRSDDRIGTRSSPASPRFRFTRK